MKRIRGMPRDIITAIDIGTTKISVLIAERTSQDRLDIIGIGKSPSKGMARGVVVDIGPAVQSIKEAVGEAELMSGVRVESAVIGISGSHIRACNSQGVVAIKQREIRKNDVNQVIAAARAIPLPEGQQILHVLPQFYVIDGEHRVKDPIGMFGVRLEAQAHIIMGALSSAQNLVRCCEMSGIKVRDIILEPLASADAVLSEDEKELGAFMLDIGGGTADFAFYHQGTIRHTKVVPIAGNLFTQDIALCLHTTLSDAERVKRLLSSEIQKESMIEVEHVQGDAMHSVSYQDAYDVVSARAYELFGIIKDEIVKHNLQAPTGLILTGGGSLLVDIDKIAKEVLHIPVRVGRPKVHFGFQELLSNPLYATGYGLLVYTLKKYKSQAFGELNGSMGARVYTRMRSWVADLF